MKSLVLLCAGLLAAATLLAQPVATDEPPTTEKSAVSATRAEQYAAAQKRRDVLKLQHGETHPLVIQQQALVAKLQLAARAEEEKKARQAAKSGDDKVVRLAKAKEELAKLLERYTEAHPVVIAKRKEIAALEQER